MGCATPLVPEAAGIEEEVCASILAVGRPRKKHMPTTIKLRRHRKIQKTEPFSSLLAVSLISANVQRSNHVKELPR